MVHSIDGGRLSVEPDVLFVYGSLTFREVLEIVLGRVPATVPATATGWRVAALRDRPFPALERADGTVSGLVLTDLTADEWRAVDAFEAPAYDLVMVRLDGGGTAWTYLGGDSDDSLVAVSDDWDRTWFATGQLGHYLRRCLTWRAGYEAAATQRELIESMGGTLAVE